jgi:flagellin
VAITGASGTDGLVNAAGTAGANAVPTTNATFYVDGNVVTLDQNYGTQALLAADIASQLTGYTADYNVSAAGKVTIAKTGSTGAVDITGADVNATAGGFGFASGTAGVSGGSITLANFSINGTSLAATYASTTALATAINSSVTNVYATVVSGALKLTSSADLALGGAEATGSLGFGSATVVANSGSLSTVNTLDVDAANTTIQRIDSALSTVSTLRSTFGAIQNRFDSVISSLSATSENLTAARSRIQDADFAAETAALTRNQILQQAGIAMLAQANAIPNQVLTLLRG